MKKPTKSAVQTMVMEIVELLCSDEYKDFWSHISIYANDKVYSSEPQNDPDAKHWVINGQKVYITEDFEPNFSRFLPASEDHVLSMTFEGDLSRVIGYDYDMPEFMEKFSAIFKKYGVFYEPLESWNLTCYPV